MGSIGNTARQASFDGQLYAKGLKLQQCTIRADEGTWVMNPAAVIRQGQFVKQDADGFIIVGDGDETIGLAKWGSAPLGRSLKMDVPIVLTGTTAVSVGRGNISGVSVRADPNFGTAYTVTTDYTVQAVAGTITRVALGGIADGETVYVTFTFELVASDFLFDGVSSFRNQNENKVLGQEDRLTVVQFGCKIVSAEWDTSEDYAIGDPLFVSTAGQATATSGTDFVGRVFQLPNSDVGGVPDLYLGYIYHGVPVA